MSSKEEYEVVDSFKDAIGNTVVVGDEIAYAVRSGNTGALRQGKVTWIRSITHPRRKWDYINKQYVDCTEVFTKWKIRVDGGGTLEYPNRIVNITSIIPKT